MIFCRLDTSNLWQSLVNSEFYDLSLIIKANICYILMELHEKKKQNETCRFFERRFKQLMAIVETNMAASILKFDSLDESSNLAVLNISNFFKEESSKFKNLQ